MPTGRELTTIGLLAIGYGLLFGWALRFTAPPDAIPFIGLPEGFALGCLVLLPPRLWPWVFAAVAATTFGLEYSVDQRPADIALGLFAASAITGFGGAWLFRRFCGERNGFQTYRQLGAFLLLCVALLPAASAVIGAGVITRYGLDDDFSWAFLTGFVAAALGVLHIAPLVVYAAKGVREGFWHDRKQRNLYLALMGLLLASVLIVGLPDTASVRPNVLMLLGLPVLILIALTTGLWGAISAGSLLTLATLQLVVFGVAAGPLDDGHPAASVFELRTHLLAATVAALFVALAVEQLKRSRNQLAESSSRYQALFDHSPIALLEEDFSAIKQYLDRQLADAGTTDLEDWFTRHPSAVHRCSRLAKIVSVNAGAGEIFNTTANRDLLANLDRLFDENALSILRQELIAFHDGQREFSSQAEQQATTSRKTFMTVRAAIIPGHEEDWGRVIVVVEDISGLKQTEHELALQAERSLALLQLPKTAEGLDEESFIQAGLEIAEQLTGSQLSFAHFIDDDAAYPDTMGLPDGHAGQQRRISLPVITQDKVVMRLGVGNKATDYTADDVETLQLIGNDIWRIAEQRRGANALRESEAALRQAQRIAHIGSWDLDLKSDRLSWSDEVYRIFDRRPDEFQPSYAAFLELVHPDDRDAVDTAFTKATEGSTAYGITHRLLLADGGIKHVREQAEIGYADDGTAAHAIGTVQDITEAVEAANRIRESEQRFRAIFTQAAVGIARVALDGRWLDVNDALCRIAGYSRDEMLGMTFQQITHPDDVGQDIAFIEAALAGTEQAHTREKRYVTKSGAHLWIQATVSLVRDKQDAPAYFVALVQDISERKRAESERDSFFDQPMDMHLIAHLDGRIVRVNDAWEEVLGFNRSELEAMVTLDLVHPDDRAAAVKEIARLGRGQKTSWFETRYRHKDGSYRSVAWSAVAEHDIIYAVGHDITEQQRTQHRLRQAATVFSNTAEGVTITDLDGTIIDVNRAFSDITGYRADEVIGKTSALLRSGRHDQEFYAAMWQSLQESGEWRGEIWNRRKDGSLYPQLLTISAVRSDSGETSGYVGVFTDITKIKQSEQRLDHLARYDPVTDLPNRQLCMERLEQGLRDAEREGVMLAVVQFDLDHFKTVNDSLGHFAGDQLLHSVAARLVEATRADDTVARISGDEFVVLLEGVAKPDYLVATVDKLMGAFNTPFDAKGEPLRITASAGISVFPQDGNEAPALLRNADAATHHAKEDGRNTYHFYTEELTTAAFEHLFLENSLRSALDNDEFRLVYQPQIDLCSGLCIGVETLLRWEHPQQGTISPARFIPIAEQTGQIRDIGRWVLRQACAQGRQWLDQGYRFERIAVNVAGPQVQDQAFAAQVSKTLEETGFPAEYLELEVTEGFVMRRVKHSVDQLHRLRDMGIAIAIDDFGTGYSSLAYLKRLPIDTLKIDQSFVRDIPRDTNDMAISAAVIAMGQALDLNTVAEGVETQAQADFFRDKGCRLAQGYLFSHPLPAAEVARHLQPADDEQ